jgi:hypothetical protein
MEPSEKELFFGIFLELGALLDVEQRKSHNQNAERKPENIHIHTPFQCLEKTSYTYIVLISRA